MHELLFSKPDDLLMFSAKNEHQIHDFQLLGLDIDDISKASLCRQFQKSNAFKWLSNLLLTRQSMRFGEVSSCMHNSILDDPLPYRKEIKELVANLFAWFAMIDGEFEVFRPSHTQVIHRR